MSFCTVEIWQADQWRRAGEAHIVDEGAGYASPGRFEYDFDYLDHLDDVALGAIDQRAVSCRYPVGYEVRDEDRWPAFLLDIIPSGAARRFWERELSLPNTSASDFSVLVRGAGNPPGNVRIAEAVKRSDVNHAGFSKEEVIARADHFLEYARERGAEIAGASGAGGDSPKLLLREDRDGRFHADGALADARTSGLWLVKFPRTHKAIDHVVLEAEAAYHRIAKRFGLRTSRSPTWERDCLFFPRFDCVLREAIVERFGLESLCSLSGVTDFGLSIAKETQAAALMKVATSPENEIREFLLRDVLDVALGNTDNHARNTAVLKRDGNIALSPIFDFGPMFLDSQGIARVCRWSDETSGFPRFHAIAQKLGGDDLAAWMRSIAPRMNMLTTWVEEERVDERVRADVALRIDRVRRDMEGS